MRYIKYDGKDVVMATHPKMPNTSGNARGRSAHLDKGGKLTICNLKVTERRDEYSLPHKWCKICFHNFDRTKLSLTQH